MFKNLKISKKSQKNQNRNDRTEAKKRIARHLAKIKL